MATWPSGTKASATTTAADSNSISGARGDINQAITNQNEIIDMFNIPASPTDNYILVYNSATSQFDVEANSAALSQLSQDLDQNGYMIKDDSRNFQILGNQSNTTTLQSYFDSFSGTTPGQRVHGVVNVNEVTTVTDRIHSNPRLSYVQASQDSSGNANSGRIRQNYVEGIYDLASYDNTVSGFGRGQNSVFVSGLTTNSVSSTTSNLTEQTALVVTTQIDNGGTDNDNDVVITDMAGIEVQGYCRGPDSSATNFYGFYYNAPDGPNSANLGTSNHYSFYGADSNATLYNAGPLQASGLSYPTSDGSANQVIKTDGSGNLSFVDAGEPDISITTTAGETTLQPSTTNDDLTVSGNGTGITTIGNGSGLVSIASKGGDEMIVGASSLGTGGIVISDQTSATTGNIYRSGSGGFGIGSTSHQTVIDSNGALNIRNQNVSSTPTNTSTPAAWLDIDINGTTYYIPLHQ